MNIKRVKKYLLFLSLLVIVSILFGRGNLVSAEGSTISSFVNAIRSMPRLDAPDTAVNLTEAATAAQLAGADDAPHYFSSPNYASSPLPTISGSVISVGNPLVARTYATDYANTQGLVPVFVVVPTAVLPDGLVQSFEIFNQDTPGSSPTPSAGNAFHAYVLRPTGTANEYMVVYDSGELTVPVAAVGGNVASFPVPDIAVQGGDVIGFYGAGIPVDITNAGTDIFSYPAPAEPAAGDTLMIGSAAFPDFGQARTYSFGASVLDLSGNNTTISGGIRKFINELPGLGPDNANNIGQYIPVAVADTTTYPGADYYEIAVVEYEEQMHTDLPPTKLRGYVQLSTDVIPGSQIPLTNPDGSPILLPDGTQALAVDNPHYMGPMISSTKDKPVRILFRNLLPIGQGGNLFIPVDTTVMGAGRGPDLAGVAETDPLKPMCGELPKPFGCYTENRATVHLHGGITPWISDGTPHQWITPANENTAYPEGVSVENVPDMPDPGPGAMTLFYTNQQSARLSFYHDHAWGITRLNVYAGMAAPYLITDPTEQALIDDGLIPAEQIPMVIQDKTFVPSVEQLAEQDPNWDLNLWGDLGDLWVPHVYSPAQNPGDSSGVNEYGRWAYGPWFWPPTRNIDHGPVANPYYDPNCDPDLTWCEPPLMPGTPYVSMGMEAFNDTPTINGTAYPTLTLDPKSYRFRILNAANDRFFNLSLYKADESGTEVALNPNEVAAALIDPAGVFPTPVSGTEGPDWIQIGSEGGFLPAPVVIPPQPTTWVTDPTVFNAGNVDQHSLLLGPAERADVIVDFSQFAGQTLILYNDAPAAFPARDPRYDYYTGNPDLTDIGGTPSTLPGYGPNIRTVMQIVVNDVPAEPAFDLPQLEAAFTHQPDGSGVFESGQNPIIVGQGAYNSAYGTTFKTNGPTAGLVQIFENEFTFETLSGNTLTIPLQPKQIQDEMGEAFDPEYGRMSGFLGLEAPNATAGVQNMILYPYSNPASEILDGIELPPGVDVTPITSADDGTQIWKITHNGVDTHPIHWHLYDVQVINRVGWDGIIRRPDPNELGWKDTVRISPLEDTIIALRPIIPKIPFGVPDSIRPLNPMMPIGATGGFNNTDKFGNPIEPPLTNEMVNFAWEYVWHCHILSHEEMDMMRPVSVNVARELPAAPVLTATGDPGGPIDLSWTDGTPIDILDMDTWGDPANEVGYRVERSTSGGTFEEIGLVLANMTSFTDDTAVDGTGYEYRVVAFNAAGEITSNVIEVGTARVPVVVVTVQDTDGTPDVGLPVYVFNDTTYTGISGTTDANGRVSFTLPDGSYRFRADKNGTQFFSDTANHCTVLGCTAVTITTTIPVTVTVQDTDGLPEEGLLVYVFDGTIYSGKSGTTDANGQVAFTMLPGSYRFRADKNGTRYFSDAANHCTIPGCTAASITTTPAVVVTVTDTDGGPEAGLPVYVFDGTTYTGQTGTTDANGQVSFNLLSGSYRFRADKGGTQFFSDAVNHCTVPGCTTASITTTLPVLVSVVDSDGAPEAGLPVYVFDGATYTGKTGVTDANGEVSFILLQGSYRFRTDKDGTQFFSDAVNHCTIPGCTDISITTTTPVVVTVQTANGIPEPGLSVYVFDGTTYTGQTGTTDTNGQVSFTLLPGSYRFRADKDGTQYFSDTVNHCTVPGCTAATVSTPGVATPVYFSTAGTGAAASIPGVAGPYDDADIYNWDGAAFSRFFDGSVAGLPGFADVDAMHVIGPNQFYLSFASNIGSVQDEDVIFYDNGVGDVYFDATAAGLTNTGHNIDALYVAGTMLYFSTSGSGPASAIPSVAGPYDDADIYSWDGTVFSRVFDASAAGLDAAADIDGLDMVDDTHFYISFREAENIVPGIGTVEDEDVIYFNNGAWSMYFDGTANGLTNVERNIDAFDIP